MLGDTYGAVRDYSFRLVRPSTETNRDMYLSYSNLLHHFIECSTCSKPFFYSLQTNLLLTIKVEKPLSAFSSSKKLLFIGPFHWKHTWKRKCIIPVSSVILTFNRSFALFSPHVSMFRPRVSSHKATSQLTFAYVLDIYVYRQAWKNGISSNPYDYE